MNTLVANTYGGSNIAIGQGALQTNTTNSNNTAVGYQALYTADAVNNTAVGYLTLKATTTGYNNVAIGHSALLSNTSGSINTAVGVSALANNTYGSSNTAVGQQALNSATTGSNNTAIGYGSASAITYGSNNTVLGGYTGNSGGLDIRVASNYMVLSDGAGNIGLSVAASKSVALQGAVPVTGAGLSFPATQVACSDVNTLDDYEEGTWTPTLTFATPGDLSVAYTRNTGRYVKIGSTVYVSFTIVTSSFTFTTAAGALQMTGLPFALVNNTQNYGNAGIGFAGYTKANYTQSVLSLIPGTSYSQFSLFGSGQVSASVTTVETLSGTSKSIEGQFHYIA